MGEAVAVWYLTLPYILPKVKFKVDMIFFHFYFLLQNFVTSFGILNLL